MSKRLPEPPMLHRDGTSQAGRLLAALDPGYVSVDERSVKDLLAFAKEYAKEMRYFNERNEAEGDWSGFLEGNLDDMAAYLQDPERIQDDPDSRSRYSRPHVALFFTFLQLLQHARIQLNELTRRHLDFYYKEVLRLTPREAVPDCIHVLVKLAEGQEQFHVPAGTLLHAGQDSQGNDLFYRTDNEILANQAKVACLKSQFVEKQVIGIPEVYQRPDILIELDAPCSGYLKKLEFDADKKFMGMLAMALGDPGPGGELAPYPGDRTVNISLLNSLDELLSFIPSTLHMTFPVFRSLMQLKLKRDPTDQEWARKWVQVADREWARINDILENAGNRRDKTFCLDRSDPRDFEKNLLAALGLKNFARFFDGLPDVENIYELYRRRKREDVQDFIRNNLYLSLDEFNTMMEAIDEIYKDWRRIYDILRTAGRKIQREHPEHKIEPPNIREYETDKFGSLTKKTLGRVDYPAIQDMPLGNLDDCYNEVLNLESYFRMSAEDFVFIREIHAKDTGAEDAKEKARPWEWDQVYQILEEAYRKKVLARELPERREALKEIRTSKGFEAMISFALGDPKPGDKLPDGKTFMELDPVNDEQYIREKLYLEVTNFRYIRDVANLELQRNATDEEWKNVYTMLERAQRRKRGWGEPRAEIEKWENIYAAPDATRVRVRPGLEEAPATPRWRTFGEAHPPDGDACMAPATLGVAVASPLLALAEGKRTITLTFGFNKDQFNKDDKDAIDKTLDETIPFRFLLSIGEKMVEVINDERTREKEPNVEIECGWFIVEGDEEAYAHALQITLRLDEQAPPVEPLKGDGGILTPWPVLQILLKDIKKGNTATKRYGAFQSLLLKKVHIKVDVEGIKALTLQNDDGILDAKKPFEPFGLSPVVGSSFYIAHPELCAKRLDKLGMKIDWLGVPDDLSDYYKGYTNYEDPEEKPESPIADNTVFKAQLKLYNNRAFFNVDKIQLFHADKNKNTGAAKTRTIDVGLEEFKKDYPNYGIDLQPVYGEEVLDWSRYWQIELLDPDLKHMVYPHAAAGCARKTEKTENNKPKPFIVNPPYTPKIKTLSMSYSASVEIDPTADCPASQDQLYHIGPFGYGTIARDDAEQYPFLPQFEHEGELFIGIKDLSPPRDLYLLFQMAESSADPDIERGTVRWSCLSGNRWQSLEEGRVLSDTTNGLLNTGIIKFDLPSVEPSTILPADSYWIRAAIVKNSRSLADMVAIRTHAVSATFVDHNNAPDHLNRPLPAKAITGLADPQPEVTAIEQPYSSMGGNGPEQAGCFYTRVSERLRHKNRALTSWDYERMVLDAFPGIYKVKCLHVEASEDPRLADQIQIIVIPDIRGKLPFDPFEPKVPADSLWRIKQYLLRHITPFARFKVKNPTYVHLKVRVGVRFRKGYNPPGYYSKLLNEELQRYLAPWAYDQSAEIVFGGKINDSLIINFVEEHPYVDYVAGIKFFTSLDGTDFIPATPEEDKLQGVFAGAPDAILVSARRHEIDLITEEGYEEEYFTGINYMKIELDFKVAGE